VYSPADSADHAEECSGAALFRRERQFCVVNVVLGFVCDNQRDLRENRPFTHTKNYVDEYKNNNNGRSHGNKGN
jgi:hypothetical protein